MFTYLLPGISPLTGTRESAAGPGDSAGELLLREFPKRHQIGPGLWAIGTEFATPVEVCQVLGLTREKATTAPSRTSGIVVEMQEYYGMFDPGLWQEISAWRTA